MKYVFCVRAKDVGIILKIIYGQSMRRMSGCRVRFGHCGREFLSPVIYKCVSAKIIIMSGSVF